MASTTNFPPDGYPGNRVTPPKVNGQVSLPEARSMETSGQLGAPTDHTAALREEMRGEAKGFLARQESPAKPEFDFLQRLKEAESQSRNYIDSSVRTAWTRSYKAFRNEHAGGSKYLTKEWLGRSKIFRPKTRVAVRKAAATAASALFSTNDAVQVSPGNEADPKQRASAALKQELLKYRLDRQSGKASIPWFLTAMGAQQDAEIAGICISKQYWLYRSRKERQTVLKDVTRDVTPQDMMSGTIPVDPFTMMPLADTITEQQQVMEDVEIVEMNRPDIIVYPPENVLIDPAANWLNPAQSAAYVILKTPMHADDVLAMVKQESQTIPWQKVTREELHQYSQPSFDGESVRRSREGGRDRLTDGTVNGPQLGIIWIYEVFMRVEGEEFHFYSIGTGRYLSKPIPLRQAYPEQHGERPIAFGYGQIESHRIMPMSKVESLQPLQAEANDIVNLRLDQVKQIVLPIGKVKRGAMVDLDALRRRGPNSTVLMQNPETDLVWDRPPDVPASAYNEQNLLNADFDDLSGSFSGGSVATNREMNETVGGLNLLSGAANAVSEFDLRVWTETWVEPALAQVVRLEEYYEADEVVLGICGDRAQLVQEYGVNVIDDELMQQQVQTKVDVGIGASDPMQKLMKFKNASEIAGALIGPAVQAGEVKIKPQEVWDEVFGAAGYADAGERFLEIVPPEMLGQKEDPAIAKARMDAEVKRQQLADQLEIEKLKIASAERIATLEMNNKIKIAQIEAKVDIATEVMGMAVDQQKTQMTLQHQGTQAELADQRKAGMAAEADDRKGRMAAEADERKGIQQFALGQQKGEQAMALGEQRGQQALAQGEQKGTQAMDQQALQGQQALDQARLQGEQGMAQQAQKGMIDAAMGEQGHIQGKETAAQGHRNAKELALMQPLKEGERRPKPPAMPKVKESSGVMSPGGMMQEMMRMVQEMNEGWRATYDEMRGMRKKDEAEIELVYDPITGSLQGARTPQGMRHLQRDPVTGRAMGLGPPIPEDAEPQAAAPPQQPPM